MSGRHLAYPFHIGADGRTATPASIDEHVRGEIIQLLLTNPGERTFLPSFGGGLKRLVFERNDDVMAGLSKALVSQALSNWLGTRVEVSQLDVDAQESTFTVDLRYRVIASGVEKQLRFERSRGGA
ncbi:MAG: GPW/gp25 family protein [Steroidobacterales bacterium]